MIYVGIDPGQSGGIAWLSSTGAQVAKMPETGGDLLMLLERVVRLPANAYTPANEVGRDVVVAIERAQAMPPSVQGRIQGVASTFKFGQHYGTLCGLLLALRVPFVAVSSVVWQKALGCLTHGDKTISKARAQQLYPHLKVTHATADALLIATWCARQDWRGVVADAPPPARADDLLALQILDEIQERF
jgi:hypothetical protein